MKRAAFLLLALLPMVQFAQTIVSTEPQNKNVVLEQFTGVNCGYCPQGTTVSNGIYNANPDRVVIVAVHAGGYANPSTGQPDFRTPFGNSLASQSNLAGYPAGTVNRHVFPGWGMNSGSTAMGRDKWANAATQILGQQAYVNVGATAEISLASREITVYVEAYYTGSSPQSTNKLNVVLLQDKTYGYQAGGGANYEHNNRLVHMLSGQWGTVISNTTAGSLHTETFNYTIPFDYNNIPAVLDDLRVAVYVAEGNQEIISGIQIKPTFANAPEFEYRVVSVETPSVLFNGIIAPNFTVHSLGQSLTSLNIQYKVNDEDFHNYTWEGSINYNETTVITLPEIDFNIRPINTLTINVLNEDNSIDNNSITADFIRAQATTNLNLTLQIRTNMQGAEVTWNIKNEAGDIMIFDGPYGNGVYTATVDLELPIDNYILNIYDSYGDGMVGGYIKIMDGTSTFINITGNSYTTHGSEMFRVVAPANITTNPLDGDVNVDGDGPFTISSNKSLFLKIGGIPLTTATVPGVLTLKKTNSTGENIPYTATVSDQKNITITPNAPIAIGTVVYLKLSVKDEDVVDINKEITFTMGAVDINSVTLEKVAIYPNPANSYFTVSGAENGRVTVFNIAGQLIIDQQINNDNQIIDIPTNAKGVLMVKIQKEDAVITKSLVVM